MTEAKQQRLKNQESEQIRKGSNYSAAPLHCCRRCAEEACEVAIAHEPADDS